jgi:hypothetical protein
MRKTRGVPASLSGIFANSYPVSFPTVDIDGLYEHRMTGFGKSRQALHLHLSEEVDVFTRDENEKWAESHFLIRRTYRWCV